MSKREELARLIFIMDNHRSKDPAAEWEASRARDFASYAYRIADGLIAAGYVQAPAGTASREDVLEEAAVSLEEAREYGGAYGQKQRRPSNYASAARHVRTLKTGTP